MRKMKALTLALAALELNHHWHQEYEDNEGYAGSQLEDDNWEAIKALKAALAAEPACFASFNKQGDVSRTTKHPDNWSRVPLYRDE